MVRSCNEIRPTKFCNLHCDCDIQRQHARSKAGADTGFRKGGEGGGSA